MSERLNQLILRRRLLIMTSGIENFSNLKKKYNHPLGTTRRAFSWYLFCGGVLLRNRMRVFSIYATLSRFFILNRTFEEEKY